jgi:hypothetical protein
MKEEGIVVGSDSAQEWLLPWWWENYSRYNSHPVAFVDLGLSPEKRSWCAERGAVIDLGLDSAFVADRSQMNPLIAAVMENDVGDWFWSYRNAWFKKPFACLHSPFRKSIWMDTDCEVCGPLDELFINYGEPLSMARDLHAYSPYPIYNSGVIVFKQGEPLIAEWAQMAIEQNHLFRGNQDMLSWLIEEKKIAHVDMPGIYNWSRSSSVEKDPQAVIVHWHGPHGKKCLSQVIRGSP